MLTLLSALAAAAVIFFSVRLSGAAPGWCIFFSFLGMILVQVAVMLLLRRKSTAINSHLQALMNEVQQGLQARQNQFARRPLAQKEMMRILEHEQNEGLQKLIIALDEFQPLYKFNFMLRKQVNSMRMIFLFQQKKYDEVDALLPNCILMDMQSISIKLARMYTHDDTTIGKFFQKKAKLLKGENAVLPYSTYAWILVKQNKIEDAIQVLKEGKVKTENETITKNWEALVNGKIKQFSNAPIGDMWYALGLEEFKMPRIQQQQFRRY